MCSAEPAKYLKQKITDSTSGCKCASQCSMNYQNVLGVDRTMVFAKFYIFYCVQIICIFSTPRVEFRAKFSTWVCQTHQRSRLDACLPINKTLLKRQAIFQVSYFRLKTPKGSLHWAKVHNFQKTSLPIFKIGTTTFAWVW